MGLVRLTWEEPLNLILRCVLVHVLDLSPRQGDDHRFPFRASASVALLKSDGIQFLYHHLGPEAVDALFGKAVKAKHLLPERYRNLEGKSVLMDTVGLDRELLAPFIDALYETIEPLVHVLNTIPLES